MNARPSKIANLPQEHEKLWKTNSEMVFQNSPLRGQVKNTLI
jgi:hypothetical protein